MIVLVTNVKIGVALIHLILKRHENVDQSALVRTDTESYCPYKGEASYYSIKVDDTTAVDAVWEYQSPYPPVADIKGHIAFYPDRVDSIDVEADGDRS